MNHQLRRETPTSSNLTEAISQISQSLQAIKPANSQLTKTTQLINYTLIATAIVGIMIYHYLKQHENATN